MEERERERQKLWWSDVLKKNMEVKLLNCQDLATGQDGDLGKSPPALSLSGNGDDDDDDEVICDAKLTI